MSFNLSYDTDEEKAKENFIPKVKGIDCRLDQYNNCRTKTS